MCGRRARFEGELGRAANARRVALPPRGFGPPALWADTPSTVSPSACEAEGAQNLCGPKASRPLRSWAKTMGERRPSLQPLCLRHESHPTRELPLTCTMPLDGREMQGTAKMTGVFSNMPRMADDNDGGESSPTHTADPVSARRVPCAPVLSPP